MAFEMFLSSLLKIQKEFRKQCSIHFVCVICCFETKPYFKQIPHAKPCSVFHFHISYMMYDNKEANTINKSPGHALVPKDASHSLLLLFFETSRLARRIKPATSCADWPSPNPLTYLFLHGLECGLRLLETISVLSNIHAEIVPITDPWSDSQKLQGKGHRKLTYWTPL